MRKKFRRFKNAHRRELKWLQRNFRQKRGIRRRLHKKRANKLSPSTLKPQRRGGQWKGQIKMSEDFDELF